MSQLAAIMPNMLRHAGEWDGTYTHLARDGTIVDRHRTWTRCEFPESGPYVYVQSNRLTWDDGRVETRSFGGTLRDGRIWWDTDRFQGFGWECDDGTVMLRLARKDAPGVEFVEMITLSADGQSRARTWQWIEQGVTTRRTLCDEWRIA